MPGLSLKLGATENLIIASETPHYLHCQINQPGTEIVCGVETILNAIDDEPYGAASNIKKQGSKRTCLSHSASFSLLSLRTSSVRGTDIFVCNHFDQEFLLQSEIWATSQSPIAIMAPPQSHCLLPKELSSSLSLSRASIAEAQFTPKSANPGDLRFHLELVGEKLRKRDF